MRQEKLTAKAWAEPASLARAGGSEATLFVELVPAEGSRLGAACAVSIPNRPPAPGLKLVKDVEEVKGDLKPAPPAGARRYRFRLGPEGALEGGETGVPVQFRYGLVEKDKPERPFSGEIAAPLLVGDSDERSPTAAPAGVALVGGMLELGLGHLCDQKGCVEHLHKSLQPVPGLVGVRPRPDLKEPGATVYVRAGQPVDVWGLRQNLRDRGVEVRHVTARDLAPWMLHVELRRWSKGEARGEAYQCLTCLERAVQAVRSVPWASQAAAGEGGIRIRPREPGPDLAALLDAMEQKGLAPSALWLVPDGAAVPKPAPPMIARPRAGPKPGGSEANPLIQIDFDHECPGAVPLLEMLGRQSWASRTGQAPDPLGVIPSSRVLDAATVLAGVGDRQHADLSSLLRDLRAAGRQPDRVRLSGFGQLRIQFEFAHLCGEVEFSKPPQPKDKKPPDGEKKEPPPAKDDAKPGPAEPKKEEKPFVPQPLRPAPSSNARQAIEKALAGVRWIQEARYLEYHTKPEFNGPRRLWLSLVPAREQDVRPDELIRVLREAGFPPLSVRVSRSFPGLGFGEPLPADLELAGPGGQARLLSSLRQPGRPLAVAFVSLSCPKWDKYNYQADPKYYRQLKQTVETWKDRVEFVAISSNPDDPFAKAVEFWERAEMPVPLLHDAQGAARSVLNAQITPPPHWFVFDGEGRLRYAGDAHENWEKPEGAQKDFLREALDLVLAGKLAANGAVFFKSPPCNCSSPGCACPKCGCGASCRCAIKHCKVGF